MLFDFPMRRAVCVGFVASYHKTGDFVNQSSFRTNGIEIVLLRIEITVFLVVTSIMSNSLAHASATHLPF